MQIWPVLSLYPPPPQKTLLTLEKHRSLRYTHICFQQIVHGGFSRLLGLMELLQGLPDLFILDFTLAFLLIIVVETTAFQLLQLVLTG